MYYVFSLISILLVRFCNFFAYHYSNRGHSVFVKYRLVSVSVFAIRAEYLVDIMASHVCLLIIFCSFDIPLKRRHVTYLGIYTLFPRNVYIFISFG